MFVDDEQILREYASTRSESAFAELVSRHANWIYSSALRTLGDAHLAEDVTQGVFLLLSQKPERTIGRPLAGWLFNATRLCAANALRSERRRAKHERKAAAAAPTVARPSTDPLWETLAPLLDELMARLHSSDRQLLLLRFYQRKTLADIGRLLGISEEVARKRAAKALDKLRGLFRARGVVAPVAAISASLLEHTTNAAPQGLIALAQTPATSQAAAMSPIARAAERTMIFNKLKPWIAFAIAILIAMAVGIAIEREISPDQIALAPSMPDPRPSAPNPYPSVVQFQLGSSNFPDGDEINITQVRGTSDTISLDNTYQVTGTYKLVSHDNAVLAAYVTAMTPGENDNAANPKSWHMVIPKGRGQFTITFRMRVRGYPHVSLYDRDTGEHFAAAYFGSGPWLLTAPIAINSGPAARVDRIRP